MAGLLTVGAAMTSVYIVAESQLNTPLRFAIDDDVFVVSEGQGLNAIATTLEERGLISSARWLRIGIQLRSSDLVLIFWTVISMEKSHINLFIGIE